MLIAYGLSLLGALLVGAGLGWLVACLHFELIAARGPEYEAELAEVQELYAARALLRHMKSIYSSLDE